MRIVFLLLGSALFLTSSCTENSKPDPYDIKVYAISVIDEHGEIWDEPQTLYIKNGIIKIIDQASAVGDFRAIREIDGSGKFLILGLWDNHVHFRGGEKLIAQNEKFLKLFTDYGITSVRDAGGDLTPQIQQWNKKIQKDDEIGPTIYTSGPKLDGPNARWAGSLEITTTSDIDNALDSLQQLGVDYVKLYDSTISASMYLEVLRQAESRRMITSGHMPFTVELGDAIDAGLDNVEHLYYILKGCSSREAEITEEIRNGNLSFWDSMEQLIETYDDKTAQKTFKKLKDNNVHVTPTLHIGNILSYLDEVDHTNDPYLKYLNQDFIATYEGRNKSARNASPKARASRKSLQEFFLKLTKSLSDYDVLLLAGSDSGAYNSYTYPGPSLHGELKQMVRAGLTEQQALQSSYRGALFLSKRNYSMKIGSRANLLLLNNNPLEDIAHTTDIDLVIIDGKESIN